MVCNQENSASWWSLQAVQVMFLCFGLVLKVLLLLQLSSSVSLETQSEASGEGRVPGAAEPSVYEAKARGG